MNNENIIALAEFVGWHLEHIDHPVESVRESCFRWTSPAGRICDSVMHKAARPPFNPYTSVDDCDAVIRKLMECGYEIAVHHSLAIPAVMLWRMEDRDIQASDPLRVIEGDDYKTGVCELALKVINTKTDNQS